MREVRLKESLVSLFKRKYLNIMIIAFLISLSFCVFSLDKREIDLWQSNWRGSSKFNNQRNSFSIPRNYLEQPNNLTYYVIKYNFLMEGILHEVDFCNKYRFIIDLGLPSRSGIYKIIDANEKKIVSKYNYSKEPLFKKSEEININKLGLPWGYRSKDNELMLVCNLSEREVSVYLNNKFCEKIILDENDLNYRIGLSSRTSTRVFVNKLQIYNNQGQPFFSFKASKFPYKAFSQLILVLGLMVFILSIYNEKVFLISFLSIIAILFVAENYLRFTEKENPYLNIHMMQPDWDLEKTTNIFGNYNSAKEIIVGPSIPLSSKYSISKPRDVLRIICLGSSPVAGGGYTICKGNRFSDFLERKINLTGNRKCEVINAGLDSGPINSIVQTIYFLDVLSKLNPDIIVVYSDWGYFLNSDVILYERMKKLVHENHAWITNQGLLRMALEFKQPVKEIVYLYKFLCESYLFMAIERLRGLINNFDYSIELAAVVKDENNKHSFDDIVQFCKKRNIKILLIPQVDFRKLLSTTQGDSRENDLNAETNSNFARLSLTNKNVYFFRIEEAFLRDKGSLLASDSTHPTEYGNRIIADEIYRKLINEGLMEDN